MYSLSDLFAYMYAADLETLKRVVPEACRILAERERNTAQDALSPSAPASQPARRS
jgi:hypothetical protein